MASMARSGETLLLKILSFHSKIKVVHNLKSVENKKDDLAFNYLKSFSNYKIFRYNKYVKHYKLRKSEILLLKQGVWEHDYKFKGFVLVRNPVSIYSSLKGYEKNKELSSIHNKKRFLRWSKDMSPNLHNEIIESQPIDQFILFYNYRMHHLFSLQLPVIRYEDVVEAPGPNFIKICDILGVNFEPEILDSHKKFEKGLIGHGKNDLSRPINKDSLTKFKNNVSKEEFSYIKEKTFNICDKYGYELNNGEIEVL